MGNRKKLKTLFFFSQGRDNMIHIWKLPSSFNETKPDLIQSIPYGAVNFCKISCYTHGILDISFKFKRFLTFQYIDNVTFMCAPSFKSTSQVDGVH
jgi:hypothetical protein